MIIEGKQKQFNLRLFNINNVIVLEVTLILATLLLFIPDKIIKIIYIFCLLITTIIYLINKVKTNVNSITFDDKKLILNGETFNKSWIEKLEIKKTDIYLKVHSSKRFCNIRFNIIFNQNNKKFIINDFNTYSDNDLIRIFTEFKKIKGEKIIIDENLILNKIKEKLHKCQ